MTSQTAQGILQRVKVVSLAINTPGPVAAARLAGLGATVTKIEPPSGDPLKNAARSWYDSLISLQTVLTLNLKDPAGRARLDELFADTDLLLASFRPSALRRMGLDWDNLHARHPRLCLVNIIGYAPPLEERSGHDLTYLAGTRLLSPPHMPPSLFVDLAGAERCVSQSLALLLHYAHTGSSAYSYVSLEDCAQDLAQPLEAGLTLAGGVLGGGSPFYGLYRASDGWIAVAALEPHFASSLLSELGLNTAARSDLERVFSARTASAWEEWAQQRDLPLMAVRG
jgi:crotonobetainyl-CoA:carnitine CoA-transferase CaiB-like acyl-CoA transferase